MPTPNYETNKKIHQLQALTIVPRTVFFDLVNKRNLPVDQNMQLSLATNFVTNTLATYAKSHPEFKINELLIQSLILGLQDYSYLINSNIQDLNYVQALQDFKEHLLATQGYGKFILHNATESWLQDLPQPAEA